MLKLCLAVPAVPARPQD